MCTVCVCVCACNREKVSRYTLHECGGQKTSFGNQLFPSIGFLGSKLRLSDLPGKHFYLLSHLSTLL